MRRRLQSFRLAGTCCQTLDASVAPSLIAGPAWNRSYGGMLSAWIRIRYPWVVHGSIAASAPVLQFTGLTGPKAYNNIITNTFGNASASCPKDVFAAWDLIKALSVEDMNKIFTPCTPLTNADQYMQIFNWLSGAIACTSALIVRDASAATLTWPFLMGCVAADMTMADYPYPTRFLGPLPGWPVNVACKFFEDNDPVTAMRMLGNLFFNYTGQAGQCFDLSKVGPATLHGLGG